MKMIRLTALALCLALIMAAPALALDADFSGEFRVQGFNHSNTDLTDPESASDSFYDMRVRVKSEFKITDNISFTTRFDALERKWGTDTVNTGEDDDNIDFDHAYATIKTPVGALIVGRLIGTKFGPSGIGDSNDGGTDKILFYVPIEDWSFAAYTQKSGENDTGTAAADSDLDKYAAVIQYKGENFKAGLLLQYYDFAGIPSMRDLQGFKTNYKAYTDAVTAATLAGGTSQVAYHTVNTYLQNPAALEVAPGVSLATVLQLPAPGGAGVANLANVTGNAALITSSAQNLVLAPTGGTNADVDAATAFIANYALADAGNKTLGQLKADATAAEAVATAAGLLVKDGPVYTDATALAIDPYVEGSIGPFSYFGELIYVFGEADREIADVRSTEDIDLLTYHVEGKYDFGPAALRAGYWFLSGDNDTTDRELNALAFIERNQDLDIAFILTGSGEFTNAGLENSLGGGMGNFAAAQGLTGPTDGITAVAGAKMIYAGVEFSPMEDLSVDLLYANAKAESPPGTRMGFNTNWSDDIGNEYDATVTWTPMDNLEYKVVAAFLDAGDFWKGDDPTAKVEDNLTLYNALTLSF